MVVRREGWILGKKKKMMMQGHIKKGERKREKISSIRM